MDNRISHRLEEVALAQQRDKEKVKLGEILRLIEVIRQFQLNSQNRRVDDVYVLFDAASRLSRIKQKISAQYCVVVNDLKSIPLPLVGFLDLDNELQASNLAVFLVDAVKTYKQQPKEVREIVENIVRHGNAETEADKIFRKSQAEPEFEIVKTYALNQGIFPTKSNNSKPDSPKPGI